MTTATAADDPKPPRCPSCLHPETEFYGRTNGKDCCRCKRCAHTWTAKVRSGVFLTPVSNQRN